MSHEASGQEPQDALDVIEAQDGIIRELFGRWDHHLQQLQEGDSVEVRWEKGSEGKLLLQHVALRESGKEALAGRLRQIDRHDLADRVEGDGVARRHAIDRCDELIRGHQAITVNTPEIDAALAHLEQLVAAELDDELGELLPEARRLLGEPGQRGLASARHVRTHSPTHPSPVPRWYDKIGPLKAARALYDHLRTAPGGGTTPSVDRAREHDPGLSPKS